jgi:type I restriction enzyme S subunit
MSWRTVRLGELVDNFSVRAKDVGGADGLDFFGVSNEEGIIKTKYAAEDKAEDYKIIEKGCFAYNPYRVNVGSIGLVSDDTRGLISPAYVVFKPKPKSIIPELLFKFLKSDEGLRQIIFYARGTVRQALRFEDLCNIEITIPEYEEQQILYNKLINSQEASNVLDAELKNQLGLLKQLRQQLLQDAVQGKLVAPSPLERAGGEAYEPASELLKKIKAALRQAQGSKKVKELLPIKPEEIPFEIPENWVWCRLGEICDYEQGVQVDVNLQKSTHEEDLVRFLRIIDYTQETDELRYIKSPGIKYHIREDELVMVRYGATAGFVGTGKSGILANNLFKIKYGILSKNFMMYFFRSKYFNSQLSQNTKGVAMPAISFKFLDSLAFPLPPLAEQNRIVQKLDELMKYCNELEASIKQSESQNEKLLQQVLREALRPAPSNTGKEEVAV